MDQATSVCWDCLVDLNNFYYFKLTCLEKQKEIETNVFTNQKKIKLGYTSVENLSTPNKEKCENIFQWFDLKGAKSVKHFEDKISQTLNETLDASTQSELAPETLDASTQSQVAPLTIQETNSSQKGGYSFDKLKRSATKNKKTQTSFKGKAVSTQCESVDIETKTKTKTTKIQSSSSSMAIPQITGIFSNCNGAAVQTLESIGLHPSNKVDKKCQTESEIVSTDKANITIQTDPTPQQSVSAQCDIYNVSQLTQSSPKKGCESKKDICEEENCSRIESQISTTPQNPEPVTSTFDTSLVVIRHASAEFVKVCDICATISYSKRQAMLHSKTHKRCKFCKIDFKTMNQTKNHAKYCTLRQLPIVILNRVELEPGVREKYPNLLG